MKFKKVKLLPTPFELHVLICGKDQNEEMFNQMHLLYGADVSYYRDEFDVNTAFVSTINSTEESLSKGHRIIVMRLLSLDDLSEIVHETVHAVFHIAKICHLPYSHKCQEWGAYMTDYLFEQISEKTVYHELYSTYEEI